MEIKIKKVKDFIKDGPPQFHVVGRCTPGAIVNVDICASVVFDENNGVKLNESSYSEAIHPDFSSKKGLIKKVERIKDGQIIKMSDSVTIAGGSHFVVQFSEDLIHCYVISSYSNKPEKKEAEINSISSVSNNDSSDEELCDIKDDEDVL